MTLFNYYRTFGLPDFSTIEMVASSFKYNYKALFPKQDGDESSAEALDALKKAYNILGDPEIKHSYDAALQDYLTAIRGALDYYAILYIPAFTSLEDAINDEYFTESMRFQPPEEHATALAYIKEAYAVLTDPDKKEKYDAALKLKHASPGK